MAWPWELQRVAAPAIDSRAQIFTAHCWRGEKLKQGHWGGFQTTCSPGILQIYRQANCRPRRVVVSRAGLGGAREGMGDKSRERTTCRRLNCRHDYQSWVVFADSSFLGNSRFGQDVVGPWRVDEPADAAGNQASVDNTNRICPILGCPAVVIRDKRESWADVPSCLQTSDR
jgi:hypothetical protein